ncbi:hypothetical protein STVA_41840 [Allostella vacuolata]|nr:hypothetical protein STVA_41840 [Stella vacuolata]
MKRLLIASAILLGQATAVSAGCGYPPLPPLPGIGCWKMVPVCDCRHNGQCQWFFQCMRQ